MEEYEEYEEYEEQYENLSTEEREAEDEFVETLDHWEYMAHVGMIDKWEI